MPDDIPTQAGMAMLYLGVFGSALGFTLYFYLLKNLEANRVSLITLMTPVIALILGQMLNGEVISQEVLYGSSLIIIGLVMHLWGDHFVGQFAAVKISRSG